jgi:hypothetical protein
MRLLSTYRLFFNKFILYWNLDNYFGSIQNINSRRTDYPHSIFIYKYVLLLRRIKYFFHRSNRFKRVLKKVYLANKRALCYNYLLLQKYNYTSVMTIKWWDILHHYWTNNFIVNRHKLVFYQFNTTNVDTQIYNVDRFNPSIIIDLPYIQSYYFFSFFWFDNFTFIKWYTLLWIFQTSTSQLLNAQPLRKSIIEFHKKYMNQSVIPSFHNIEFYLSSLYHHLFTFINIFTISHLNDTATNSVIWLATVTPKSFNTARRQFYYYHHKRFIYQKQITKYILNYYRFAIWELIWIQEFRLSILLLRSQLCLIETILTQLCQAKWIFLNHSPVTSLSILLYPFDCINLIITSSFFLFYQWQILYIEFKLNRFLYYTRYWTLRSFRPYPKQASFRIPHWVIFYRFLIFEIPVYMEVDFLTLTCIIFNYYHYSLLYYYYYSFKEIPYTVIRNHNWKLLV